MAWLASRGVSYQGGTGFFEANLLYSGGYDNKFYIIQLINREKSHIL